MIYFGMLNTIYDDILFYTMLYYNLAIVLRPSATISAEAWHGNLSITPLGSNGLGFRV